MLLLLLFPTILATKQLLSKFQFVERIILDKKGWGMVEFAKILKGATAMAAITVMYNMISAHQRDEVTVDLPGLYCRTRNSE